MRKVIAAINMTLDGICDHTSVTPDQEIHNYYADLLRSGDIALFGRITYQLMIYWQTLLSNPSGDKSMDDFAAAIDGIPKIVFSTTLKSVDWQSASIAKRALKDEVLALRQQSGRDVLVSSRSLIIALLKLNLIDELQICVHPVISGKGLLLFNDIDLKTDLTLIKTKTFGSGAVLLCYQPAKS